MNLVRLLPMIAGLAFQEPQGAKQLLEDAVRRTRSQESYEVRAQARAKFPNGAFEYTGVQE